MSGKTREQLMALPVRSYLDETCVPLVMQALAAVSRERPEDPIEYIAHYLLKNNTGAGGRRVDSPTRK
jgi:protein dpy-30